MTSESKSTEHKVSKGKEHYLLVLMIILGCCGLLTYLVKEKSVFPSASVNLSIPKSRILDIAETWTKKLGYKKDNLIKSIAFNLDDDAKTFLEYNLGNTNANELMKEQVPVFYWSCFFKKEFDQETMDINISPQGKLDYFEHNFPNDLAITTIDHAAALEMAQAFVLEQTGWSKDECKLVEDNTDSQLHRKDYDFTWEYEKPDWQGAKLRASASVAGNILSGYYKYLHLPDTWGRKYQNIRSYNSLLFSIASIFYFALHIAAVVIFFRGLTVKDLRWRFALSCAGILTIISLLDGLNNIQASLVNYDSKQSYTAFLCTTYFGLLIGLPFIYILTTIMASAAERIYRLTFTQHLPLTKWFSNTALRSRYVNTGLLIGLASFGISLGYQICYYALGKKFNFWCPLGVDYYQILSSTFPWFGAFTLGIFASASEESLYRVLMLGLMQRLFKNFWIANILQAIAWAFMHSTYPQQPCYTRGIELSIEGVFWGWVLRKYGLLACLVSHYLFDVLCEVIPLLSAPLLGLRISAFIPLLPFLILYIISSILRSKQGAPPEDEIVVAESQATPESTLTINTSRAVNFDYQPLAKSTRWYLLLTIAILFTVSVCWPKQHSMIYSGGLPLKVNQSKATKIAHDYLTGKKFNLTDYWSSATLSDSLPYQQQQFQYMFEKVGFDRTDAIAREIEDPHVWNIRYFKPGTAQEYTVSVNHVGEVRNMTVTKLDDDPGARLSEDQAKEIGLAFIHSQPSVYEPLVFDNAEVKDRPHRTDHSYEFKSPKYKVADADLIVSVKVLGDVASSINHNWKIPDDWAWQRTKMTLEKALVGIGIGVFMLVGFGLYIWWLVYLFRANHVQWRPAFLPSLAFLSAMILLLLNFTPVSFSFYPTTISVTTYLTSLIIGCLIIVLMISAFMIFIFATALAAVRHLNFTDQILLALQSFNPRLTGDKVKVQFNIWLDALLCASTFILAGSILSLCSMTFSRLLSHSVVTDFRYISFDMLINSFSPLLNEILMVAYSLLSSAMVLAIVISMLVQFGIKKSWQVFALVILLISVSHAASMLLTSKFYWKEYLFHLVLSTAQFSIFWLFLKRAVQRNPLCLLISLFMADTLSHAQILIQNGWTLYKFDTIAAVLLAAAPLIFLAYLKVRSERFHKI